jgi:hypothetical protein
MTGIAPMSGPGRLPPYHEPCKSTLCVFASESCFNFAAPSAGASPCRASGTGGRRCILCEARALRGRAAGSAELTEAGGNTPPRSRAAGGGAASHWTPHGPGQGLPAAAAGL